MTKPIVNVWIQGRVWAGSIRVMLLKYPGISFIPARNIGQADMVLYTGGADVDPWLYGEKKLDCTGIDEARDKDDVACWTIARRANKFQVGICRGSQFLNVMNGGRLWQDVDGHGGTHEITDILTGKTFLGSSTHHQQSILNSKGKLLAVASRSTKKISARGAWHVGSPVKSDDVEAYWYPESRSLGCQFHPEIGPKSCEDMFFEYIERYRNAA